MKKNLIIGGCSGYDWAQIAPWVKSVNECGFQGDKIMVVFTGSYETVQKLFDHGFQAIIFGRDEQAQRVTYESNNRVHVERFIQIYKFLKEHGQNYDYVVTTDTRDVIFQSDPVAWLKENLGAKQLVAAGESIRYRDEAWNRQNLFETYGPLVYEMFCTNEVYNVGTLGGKADAIRDLMLNIFTASVNRQIPIVDQATFNVLIQSQPYKDIVKFARASDGWACQAGVSVDPSKLPGFLPYLLDKEPVFEQGVVKTAEGKKFALVHQYDRVPEWNRYFTAKYADQELKP